MRFFSILTLFLFCGVMNAQLEQNLLLNYQFDGNSMDSSINGFDGSANGITYGVDRNGNANSAVYFDGINDFIDLPNIATLKPQFPISFSFWVKYESTNIDDRAVFDTSFEDDLSSGVYFNSQGSTGRYAINHGDGTSAYNSTTRRTYVSDKEIDTNEWQHIAVIINSSTDMEIYVNCEISSGEHSGTGGPLQYANSAGSLGRHDKDPGLPPTYFKGALDDFRYWDRSLTLAEITELCQFLSIEDQLATMIEVYPNPVHDQIRIESNSLIIDSYKLYDIQGKLIQQDLFSEVIRLNFIENGIYFLKLFAEDNVLSKKIIVQK